jgi:hypothetical protein
MIPIDAFDRPWNQSIELRLEIKGGDQCKKQVCFWRLATSVFWLTMLTTPPVSEASPQTQIDTRDLTLKAHPDGGLPCDAF